MKRLCVSIFFFGNNLYFVPIAQCGGLDIEQPQKVKQLTFFSPLETKGQILKDTIDMSGEKLPSPFRYNESDFRKNIQLILELSKNQTWGKFISKALNFDVGLTESWLIFCPREYDRGGMSGIPEHEFSISRDVPLTELGNSIDKVLQYCVAKGGKTLNDLISLKKELTNPEPIDGQDNFLAVNFGYKIRWFAIKSVDVDKVAQEFSLQNIRKTDWATGIEKAYQNLVFISPPVGDWTFVVGWGLSEVVSGTESVRAKVVELSKVLGEVQYFESHRIPDAYGWVKGIDGQIVRAYFYCGERGENSLVEGEPTPVEQPYNLFNTFSEESKKSDYWDRKDIVFPDEDFVLKVAESWSIDPMSLEERDDIHGQGLLGKIGEN
jgi:hypothetical protein